MPTIPIDWASVNWLYVILLALFVFLSSLIGNFISFKRVHSEAPFFQLCCLRQLSFSGRTTGTRSPLTNIG